MATVNIPLLPAEILMASIAIGAVFVPAGKVKCITEDIRTVAMSVGRYHPTEDNSVVGLRISGRFASVVEVSGLDSACFWSPTFQISTAASVDFQWATGIAAKAWAGVANYGKLEDLEMEFKQLVESVNDIKEEMTFLRERVEEALKLNEDTNSRMGMLSRVAGLQLWHLKTYLEREKVF